MTVAESDRGGQGIQERLEYLRGEIKAERISQGELAELQSLAAHIDPGDVELLEWAGVPEHGPEEDTPDPEDTPAGDAFYEYECSPGSRVRCKNYGEFIFHYLNDKDPDLTRELMERFDQSARENA